MPVTKEKIGEEAYREFQHQAYLRRKAKLEKQRELKELSEIVIDVDKFGKKYPQSRVYWYYIGLKKGMRLALTNNESTTFAMQDIMRSISWSQDIVLQTIRGGWSAERVANYHVHILAEKVLQISEATAKFFRLVANVLGEEEAAVWECIFRFLLDGESPSWTCDISHVKKYTDFEKETIIAAILHLRKLGIIAVQGADEKTDIDFSQPLIINRGPEWIQA